MNVHNNIGFRNPGFLISFAVILLSVCFVLPGLFDSTLTSRLAIYPILGVVLLFAGRTAIPKNYFYAGIIISAIPFVSLAWTPIPVQCIVPCVRWVSFGVITAGCAGIIRKHGTGPVFKALVLGAVLAAFLLFISDNDLPAGNPNRLGPLFATGLLAVLIGAGFHNAIIRLSAGLIIAAGLYITGFYTAWIALILGILWFIIPGKQRIHPAFILSLLLAGQVFITVFPNIAGSISPTLELRSRTWRGGLGQLADNLPLGTGTGQSRLTLIQDVGEEAQLLVGDPDKRIDFLHSEFLTPVVEMGIVGFLALLIIGFFLLKRGFSLPGGTFFICALPFLLVDLPLATPLGAIPLAFCLVMGAGDVERDEHIGIHVSVPIVLLALSILWAGAVIRGYRFMETGRQYAINGYPAEASESFEKTAVLIPFEERNLLYLGASRAEESAFVACREAYRDFNSLYPGYWRGWESLAELESRYFGESESAATGWLMALRTSPATLPQKCVFAVNAAALLPDNPDDLLLVANSLGGLYSFIPPGNNEIAFLWAERLADISRTLMDEYPEKAGDLLMEAGNCLKTATVLDSRVFSILYLQAEKLADRKAVNFLSEMSD